MSNVAFKNKRPALKPAPAKNQDIVLSEGALIGIVLQNPDLFKHCERLRAEAFADEEMRTAFECMQSIYKEGIVPDVGHFQHRYQDVAQISDAETYDFVKAVYDRDDIPQLTTKVDVDIHCGNINKSYSRRRMAAMEGLIGDINRNDGLTVNQKLAKIRKIVDELEGMNAGERKLVAIAESMDLAINESLDTVERGELPGVSTGLKDLDSLIGGLGPGQLIIAAGRPAMGKTAFSMGLAYTAAAKNKKPVIYFSMEMSSTQLGVRFGAMLSGVSMGRIKHGVDNQRDLDALYKARNAHADVPLHLEERRDLTVSDICQIARRYKQQMGDLGLVVVDYLQLIDPENPNQNRNEQVAQISRKLKKLSMELDCPVLALSQLNRDLEKRQDKRPMSSDLRDSGNIEQDADVILFLYRDEVYNKESVERGKAEIIVGKQRQGEQNVTAKVGFDGAHSRFFDIEKVSAANVKEVPF